MKKGAIIFFFFEVFKSRIKSKNIRFLKESMFYHERHEGFNGKLAFKALKKKDVA